MEKQRSQVTLLQFLASQCKDWAPYCLRREFSAHLQVDWHAPSTVLALDAITSGSVCSPRLLHESGHTVLFLPVPSDHLFEPGLPGLQLLLPNLAIISETVFRDDSTQPQPCQLWRQSQEPLVRGIPRLLHPRLIWHLFQESVSRGVPRHFSPA